MLENQFILYYYDGDVIEYLGEINYAAGESLELGAGVRLFNYNMPRDVEAYHKANYKLNGTIHYSVREKVFVTCSVKHIGSRKVFMREGEMETLQPITDVSLGAEYRYSKVFSLFLDLNNLLNQKYEIWNHYASQRLNFLAGFTYKL
jgi:outer membrane receptor for ferrienterochelin and colicin